MWYKRHAEIARNTASSSPDKQTLKISKGELINWLFVCPDEAADLMKFKILYHNHQLFPYSRDEWADALIDPVPLRDSFEISVPPYILDILAYNDDDTFSHDYNIYVNIIPEKPTKVATPELDIKTIWNRIFGGEN